MKTKPGCENGTAKHDQLAQQNKPAVNCGAATLSNTEPLGMSYQPFPQAGRLADNLNQHLDNLREKISSERGIVYCYVVASIKNQNGLFYQTGSGPNFQGDLLTLCTCKRFMRAFMEPEKWVGKWVAGFSGVVAGHGHNVLVYLMKVGHAFDSHQSLWLSRDIPDTTKQLKSANLNRLGDVYRPKEPPGDRFDFRSYELPHKNHPHVADDEWHKDINYFHRNRKDALLVGDPHYSFLWNKPMLTYSNGRIHRGQKKFDLPSLLVQLEETI